MARRPVKKSSRRRLGAGASTLKFGQPVRNILRVGYKATKGVIKGVRKIKRKVAAKVYGTREIKLVPRAVAQQNFQNRLNAADNITNTPGFKFGTQKPLSFEEKVDRITHPPVIHKRSYAWSAEGFSGRKAMFGIPINKLDNNASTADTQGLYYDVMVNSSRLSGDYNAVDPTLIYQGQVNHKFYIDYYSSKLRMVNSSSNALEGCISLYAYKRDCESTFTNVSVPMTPINLTMLASTNSLVQLTPGTEATVGNGWKFDGVAGATTGSNYLQNYDMPGSTFNSVYTVCAKVDPQLEVLSKSCEYLTDYFFEKKGEYKFTLKPGQQINHWTIFNEMPNIRRVAQDMTYVKGISYYLVVEFQGGIVGDSTATTGDNKISTGIAQLSCVYEEKRIVGHRGRDKGGKVVQVSNPLIEISANAAYIINPDTGSADIATDLDA